MFKNVIVLLICFLAPIAAISQSTNKRYKIYDVKKQQLIQVDDIVKDLNAADVLFLGE
jgi:hypothetical protein